MAFTPDQPFPKTPGNPVMAKDWNDAIAEVQRLDTAKVNRAGADTIAGPLTITNALMAASSLVVGSAQAASSRLHVVDAASPAVARVQTTATNGSSRLELWSDPRGSGTEWRPGYIESFDNGTYTGGLRFVTNGTGLANRQASSEQLRLVNGLAGFGLTDPAFRIDTNGQIRIRQGAAANPTAGLHLHQATPNANRAFVGMASDTVMGLQGEPSNIWGLQMDTTTGNLGVRTAPVAGTALTVNGATQLNGNLFTTGNTGLGHNAPGLPLDVLGRARFRENNGSAGMYLYPAAAAADRAFIGMFNDTTVGLQGQPSGIWGLQMNTTTGDLTCNGRVWNNNVHVEASASGTISTTANSYVLIPNMTVAFTMTATRPVFFHFHLPNIEFTVATAGSYTFGYRIMLYWPGGGTYQVATTEPVHNNVQYYHRSIVLTRIVYCGGGQSYTAQAEWWVRQAGVTLYGCSGAGERVLQVVEL